MTTAKHSREPEKKKRMTIGKLLLLIIILAAVNAGAVFYSYKTTLNSLDIKFTDDALTVEFGGDYPAMDYVSSFKGEVSPERNHLDADSTGGKTLKYTVSQPMFGGLLTPAREFVLSYDVVDTVPPVILWNGSGAVLEKGSEFDLSNYLAYGDNADPHPSLEVEGKVNMKKEGSYKLHASVTDASGNKSESDIKIEVVETLPEYTDEIERTSFSKFVKKNAGEGRSFGIDVSVWQGDIDFKEVKAAGCEFVFIRIGYSEDGNVTQDSTFDRNIKLAREAGLKVGVYLYSYDDTQEKVRSSADWVINKLGGAALDLPVVFDWEDFLQFQNYNMCFADLNKLYDAFSERISAAGYESMLYSSPYYLENVWEDTDTRTVWLAHYTDKTGYTGPFRFWQVSNTGKIKGIKGNVDLDIMLN